MLETSIQLENLHLLVQSLFHLRPSRQKYSKVMVSNSVERYLYSMSGGLCRIFVSENACGFPKMLLIQLMSYDLSKIPINTASNLIYMYAKCMPSVQFYFLKPIFEIQGEPLSFSEHPCSLKPFYAPASCSKKGWMLFIDCKWSKHLFKSKSRTPAMNWIYKRGFVADCFCYKYGYNSNHLKK